MLHSRLKRVSEEIQQELNRILNYELNDPRVPMATVTSVKVSSDLRDAVVHVSFLSESPQAAQEALQAVDAARGFIKRLLAARIVLKRLPNPKFVLDTTTTEAYRLFELMHRIESEGKNDGGESENGDKQH